MNDVSQQATTINDADTYGWDTVFALNFTHANAAIVANWPNVSAGAKTMNQTASDDPSFNINATLGPWQLTMGGDGKNVRMNVPIASGTYNAGGKAIKLDGLNVQVIIEIGMEWVPDPNQFNFVITGATVATITGDLNQNKIDTQLQQAFTQQKKTLSSQAAAQMLISGKEWVITDGQVNYYLFYTTDKDNNQFLTIYQFEAAWLANLKALKDAVSEDEPAVAVIQIVNDPASGIAAAVLPDLLSTWFNTNIGEFNHVFAILDLSPVVAKQTNYTWMLPTSTSYAVTDQGTMDSSVFGVLTMVQNNAPGQNHQVSPYAIPSGGDAGFLISGPNFMKYMLLGGAQIIFNNAPASNFTITNDGLTITNNARILFGKFHMSDTPTTSIADNGYSAQLDAGKLPDGLVNDLANNNVILPSGSGASVTDAGSQWLISDGNVNDDEYIVNKNGSNLDFYLATSIYVDSGNFQMSLNHTWVQIQFINVTYPANSDWDTHVNYSENVPLSLKNENGKNIFWMGDSFARQLVVTATQTQAAITREIVESAVFAALSLLAIAGPIVEGLSAGAEVTEVSADSGEAVVNEEAFASVEEENPQAAEEDEEESGQAAASSSKGRWGNIKAAFKQPRWKMVGFLAGLAGAVRGVDQLIDKILEQAALKQWQNVPGFDDFAETAIEPYTWNKVPGFTLTSASLAGSLQIGLTVDPTKS